MKSKPKYPNLLGFRVGSGYNQEEFASLLGISRKWYSQKEIGNKPFSQNEIDFILKLSSKTYEELFSVQN